MKDGAIIPTKKLRGSAMPRIVKAFEKGVVGRKIVQIGYVALGDEPYPVLILDDGTTVMALQDDEGNGPGSSLLHRAEGHGRAGQILDDQHGPDHERSAHEAADGAGLQYAPVAGNPGQQRLRIE